METLGSFTANRTTAHTLTTVRNIYVISPFTNGGSRNKTQKKERASVWRCESVAVVWVQLFLSSSLSSAQGKQCSWQASGLIRPQERRSTVCSEAQRRSSGRHWSVTFTQPGTHSPIKTCRLRLEFWLLLRGILSYWLKVDTFLVIHYKHNSCG